MKTPVILMLSILFIAHPSFSMEQNQVVSSQYQACSICLEKQKIETLQKFYCDHTICNNCSAQLIADKKSQYGSRFTVCPNPHCQTTIREDMAYIKALNMRRCPNCKVPFTREGCENDRTRLVCKCKYAFCYNCLKKWEPRHSLANCLEDESWASRKIDTELYYMKSSD